MPAFLQYIVFTSWVLPVEILQPQLCSRSACVKTCLVMFKFRIWSAHRYPTGVVWVSERRKVLIYALLFNEDIFNATASLFCLYFRVCDLTWVNGRTDAPIATRRQGAQCGQSGGQWKKTWPPCLRFRKLVGVKCFYWTTRHIWAPFFARQPTQHPWDNREHFRPEINSLFSTFCIGTAGLEMVADTHSSTRRSRVEYTSLRWEMCIFIVSNVTLHCFPSDLVFSY